MAVLVDEEDRPPDGKDEGTQRHLPLPDGLSVHEGDASRIAQGELDGTIVDRTVAWPSRLTDGDSSHW